MGKIVRDLPQTQKANSYPLQQKLMLDFQPSQPLPGIFYLNNTWISVFPEGEELASFGN
jgi:hypothetical protein